MGAGGVMTWKWRRKLGPGYKEACTQGREFELHFTSNGELSKIFVPGVDTVS